MPHDVHIQIDRQDYTSPTPTTGEGLYRLAKIGEHRELFREGSGQHKDKVIPRDATEIHLKEGEHFYSEKTVTIVVEGSPHQWPDGWEISFVEVVRFEVPDYHKDSKTTYAVKYTNGPSHHPVGTLSPGGKVKVKQGMIFSVSETGQS